MAERAGGDDITVDRNAKLLSELVELMGIEPMTS